MPFKTLASLLALISLVISAPVNAEPDSVEASPEIESSAPSSKAETNSSEPRRRGKTKTTNRRQASETNSKPDPATQQKLDQLTQQIKQLQTALQTIQTAPVNNPGSSVSQAEPPKVMSAPPSALPLPSPSIPVAEPNNSSQFSLLGVFAAFATGILGVLGFQQLKRYLAHPSKQAIVAVDQISTTQPVLTEADEPLIEIIYSEPEAEPEPDSSAAPAESSNEITNLELSPGFNFDFSLPESNISLASAPNPQSNPKSVLANQTKNGKKNRA